MPKASVECDYCAYVGAVEDALNPDEFADFRKAALLDTLKELGPMSKEEYDYYENLCLEEEK